MSTYFPSGSGLAQNRKWYVVDAAGKTVGHLASEVAAILSGKRNPKWTPFLDMGDHVIVVNARQAMFTGSKATGKVYRRHTLYPLATACGSASTRQALQSDRHAGRHALDRHVRRPCKLERCRAETLPTSLLSV